MGTIDASLNIKLGELLTQQTGLLERFDGGLNQIEGKKNETVLELNNLKNTLKLELQEVNTGGFDYEETTNPFVNTNATIHAKWLNLETAELFICIDATPDTNIWIGSSGGVVSPNEQPSDPINNFVALLYSNQSYSHVFSGATDNDGIVTHYVVDQISSANLTVAESIVAAGEPHEFSVADITNSETVSFRVRSIDDYGGYSTGIVISVNLEFSSIGVAGSAGFGVGIAPSTLTSMYGLVGMSGFDNPLSPNYGNYLHVMSDSVLVFIPKHYVRYAYDVAEPYYGQRIDVSHTQLTGYKLPRVFINNGVVVAGVFVDKYKGGIVGNMFVSRRNLDPASTYSAHNPISACTANGQAPLNRYDGMYDAVKSRGDDFAEMSVFLATMLADLADAHYQACHRNVNFSSCAWGTVEPYQPKGCNNNALTDTNDSSVVYTSSGYSNCGLTGGVSDSVFAKTTHNGQACGIADLNGLMWEVASGYITDINGVHMVLKESVDIATLSSANAYDTTLYDTVSIPVTLNGTAVYMGNGTNQFYDGSIDRATNSYKIDSLGIPKDDTALSTSGSSRFGNDGFWRYQRNEMALIVFGNWSNASSSGLRARYSNNVRSNSNNVVGGRAYLVPRIAG